MREFLGYGLSKNPPEHSGLSKTRKRLSVEARAAVFGRVVELLRSSGLLSGKTLGVDATTLRAGTLTVEPQPSSLSALVDQARTTFATGGGRNPVLINLPPDLPSVMADPERIVQVLGNLLSHAARNSPSSSPIRVAGVQQSAFVALSVSDEGQGIAPDEVPHLFRKRRGTAGGTGLGLVICKGLVEAHGGRIRAESGGIGLGASFTCTIPVAGTTAPEAIPSKATEGAPGQGRKKTPVLVVDDDPETLRYARAVLSDSGYTPIVTAEPGELSRIIRSEKPRLVLLDLMLPGTDGIKLMRQVPELEDLPVIFISAYGRDETIARALESGAVDYIVKPFSPTELVARVRAALRDRSEPEKFILGDLAIDYGSQRVRLGGRRLALTAIEFDLLRVLSLSAGAVMPTYVLLRQVCGTLQSDQRRPAHLHLQRARHRLPHAGRGED